MAIAFVNGVSAAPGSVGGNTSPIDTAGVDFFAAVMAWYPGVITTLSSYWLDSKGNSWSFLTARATSGVKVQIAYSVPTSVGSGHTFGNSDTAGFQMYPSYYVMGFSGVHQVSPYASEEDGGSGTSTSRQSGSLTPGVSDSLLIAGLAVGGATGSTPAVDSGYTALALPLSGGVNVGGGLGRLIQGAAALSTPVWTWGGTSVENAGALAVFRPAVVATGQPTMRRWGGVPHMGTQKFRGGHNGGPWGHTRDGLTVPRRAA